VGLPGRGEVPEVWDGWTVRSRRSEYLRKEGELEINLHLYAYGSILLGVREGPELCTRSEANSRRFARLMAALWRSPHGRAIPRHIEHWQNGGREYQRGLTSEALTWAKLVFASGRQGQRWQEVHTRISSP